MKKAFGLLIATSMIAVTALAGCASSKTEEEAPSGQTGGLTPIKYTINTVNPKDTWDTPFAKTLTEKTGLSLDYQPVVGDPAQKYELWAASGDYPDILHVSPFFLNRFLDAGYIIPLEGLIDKYGPNIKKKYGKYYDLLKAPDGHIYSLYGINQTTETPANSQASFAIQVDVLKEAGYPEVKTLDQLFDLLQAYYKKHPTIDGKETIGFSGSTSVK